MQAAEPAVGARVMFVGPEYFSLKDPIPSTVYAVSHRTGRVLISYDDYEFAAWVDPEELRLVDGVIAG